MASLTEHYLRSCSGKKVEPFFGFIEHTAERRVDADVDFVSPNGWSLFALSMKSVSDCNLVHFRIGRLKEKAALHPPTQSQRLLNFRRLASQFPMTDLTEAMVQRMTLGVAAMISTSPQLKYLSLQNIVIGPKGALAFSPVLALAPQLQHISLEGSMIGDSGFDVLIESLCRLPALTVLNLTSCDLTDRSAKHLGTLLKSSATRNSNYNWAASLRSSEGTATTTSASGDGKSGLTKLLLSDNFLSDKAAAVLASSLDSDDSLLTLGLSNNTIMAEGVNLLLSALSRNRVLSVLNLSGNPGALVATDSLREYGLITVTGLCTDSDEAGCIVVRSTSSAVGNVPVRTQSNVRRVGSNVTGGATGGAKASNRAQYVDPAASGPTPRGSSPVDVLTYTTSNEPPLHPQGPSLPQQGGTPFVPGTYPYPGGPPPPPSGYAGQPYPHPYPHPYPYSYPYPSPYASPYMTYPPGYPPYVGPWGAVPYPGPTGPEAPIAPPFQGPASNEAKRQRSPVELAAVSMQPTPSTLQDLMKAHAESPRPSSKAADDGVDDNGEGAMGVEPESAQALHDQQANLLKSD